MRSFHLSSSLIKTITSSFRPILKKNIVYIPIFNQHQKNSIIISAQPIAIRAPFLPLSKGLNLSLLTLCGWFNITTFEYLITIHYTCPFILVDAHLTILLAVLTKSHSQILMMDFCMDVWYYQEKDIQRVMRMCVEKWREK